VTRLPGTALIALSAFFFGAMAVLARTLAGTVPAAEATTVRFAVGALAMALYFAARRQRPDLRNWRLLALRGLLGGLAVLAYFYGIEKLGAASATILNYVAPAWAAVFAAVFLKERPSRLLVVGLVLACAGAVLVGAGTGQFFEKDASVLPVVVAIFSGVCSGAAMTTVKAVREDTDAWTVFLVFCLAGAGMSLPLALPHWVPLTGATLFTALAVGVVAIFGQLLFTIGMGFTSATAGSATTQLVPAFAVLLSAVFLHEHLTPLSVAGAVLCVAGVLVGVVRFTR
jgi:drug/metabolite transporter (DMT)-like permease